MVQLKREKTTLILTGGAILLMLFFFGRSLAQTQSMRETPLNSSGLVHELFRAANGELWASDYFADEVWRVDPAGGTYIVYENLTGASDGRIDGEGNLWWSDFDGNALGRLVPGQAQATVWSLPGTGSPLGLAFGDSGQVWASDVFDPALYRFAPNSSQLCTYTLPDQGAADYITFAGGRVWLGDTLNGRILRLNPASGNFDSWQLPDGAYPQGLALDGNNNLWWADPGLAAVGKLAPQSSQITLYPVPTLGGPAPEPQMISLNDGDVWYTDFNGRVGALDPQQAVGNSSNSARTNAAVAPSCSASDPPQRVNVSERSGQLIWGTANYPLVHNEAGWLIYNLPSGAAPWGLAASGDNVWFNDQGQAGLRAQQLGWMQLEGDPPPTVAPTPTGTIPVDEAMIYLPIVIGN